MFIVALLTNVTRPNGVETFDAVYVGVFSTEPAADAACTTTAHFYAPIPVDQPFGQTEPSSIFPRGCVATP